MMRRLCALTLLVLVSLSNVGCVINLGIAKRPIYPRAFEIDGQLYVIDEDGHHARRIEIETDPQADDPSRTEGDQSQD